MGLQEVDQTRRGLMSRGLRGVLIVLGIAVVGLQLGDAATGLRYDRAAIVAGEHWRWLTGHFVHLGIGHMLLNLAGLLLVALLVGARQSLVGWILITLASMLAMGMGFWWLEPQLTWYVGLSGLLHGWLAAGLLTAWPRGPVELRILTLLLLAKLVWEMLLGPLPGSTAVSGGAVIVAAHSYGAIGGVVAAILLRQFGRRTASP